MSKLLWWMSKLLAWWMSKLLLRRWMSKLLALVDVQTTFNYFQWMSKLLLWWMSKLLFQTTFNYLMSKLLDVQTTLTTYFPKLLL